VSTCGCTPGTEENGWHEERSEKCLQVERDAFARAIDAYLMWKSWKAEANGR
jgi:hypothetical protein